MSQKPAIRIVCDDGRALWTKVYDTETGEDLTTKLCIRKIELVIDPQDGLAKGVLHFAGWSVDASFVPRFQELNPPFRLRQPLLWRVHLWWRRFRERTSAKGTV